jgi:hypothetical protein
MTSDQQLLFVMSYTNNLTVENAVIALTELSEISPLLAFVGAGIATNGAYRTTAINVLKGQQELANQGDKLVEISGLGKASALRVDIGKGLDGVLNNDNIPPHHKMAVQSAALAFMVETRVDSLAAINAVLGGVGGAGGIQSFNGTDFVAPVGVYGETIEDRFEDNPDSLTKLSVDGSYPRTADGVRVSAETILDDGALERVGPDMFQVRMLSDGLLLLGVPGMPYTLHITLERLEDLRMVVPDAESGAAAVIGF